jgi:hypothetical protein
MPPRRTAQTRRPPLDAVVPQPPSPEITVSLLGLRDAVYGALIRTKYADWKRWTKERKGRTDWVRRCYLALTEQVMRADSASDLLDRLGGFEVPKRWRGDMHKDRTLLWLEASLFDTLQHRRDQRHYASDTLIELQRLWDDSRIYGLRPLRAFPAEEVKQKLDTRKSPTEITGIILAKWLGIKVSSLRTYLKRARKVIQPRT